MNALVVMAGVAGAHVGDIVAGIDVLVPSPDAPVSIEATFGLVIGQSDGTARWTCHEAVTTESSIFLPQYDLSRDGEWLAVLRVPEEGRDGQTLFHSPAGCAWNPVDGLEGVVVNYAAFDPDDPQRAFAVTATPKGGSVHASADGGRTWSLDLPPMTDRALHGVQVVDGEVYATGANLAGTDAFVWHRDPEGAWTSTPMPSLGELESVLVRILAVSDDAVYLNVDAPGSDVLFVADRGLTSFERTVEGEGEILDAAVGPDGVWLPLDFGDRALLLASDGTYTVSEPPPSVGAAVGADGRVLLASLAYLDGPLLNARSADGSFEALLYPDDLLAPLDCPPGTETADVCEPLWATLEPRLRGFDDPPPLAVYDTGEEPVEEASSCGCATPSPTGALGAVVGLSCVAAWRRRRTDRARRVQ